MLRARGEHPVWLQAASRRQVVDQCSDVTGLARQHHRRHPADFSSGIESCHQSLRCSFFVAGGAIYLTGKEQPGNTLRFERP